MKNREQIVDDIQIGLGMNPNDDSPLAESMFDAMLANGRIKGTEKKGYVMAEGIDFNAVAHEVADFH